MKKCIKKTAVCTLAAVMAAASFAGCGSKGGDTSAAKGTTTSAKDKNGKMTISVLGIDWGFGPKENNDMEKYYEKMFDVNLDIEWVNYEDYDQKVNTMIASDSIPDVIQVSKMGNGSYYYPIFTQAVDAGSFVDMKKYLFDGGKGIAETNAVMKNWDQSFWDQANYKDGIYILPRSIAEKGQYSGLMVRKDMMDKYGYDKEPTTTDELKDWLINFSKAATKGEGRKIYGLDFFGEKFMDDRIKAFATAFTGQTDWTVDADGNYQYMQFSDKYIDFLNFMKDLYDGGALDPEFALNNSDTSNWKNGNSVAYLGAWYNWNQSEDRVSNRIFEASVDEKAQAWCMMPVKGPEGYAISPNYTDIDSCIAISSKCSDDKIKKILEVFNGTEEKYPGYNDLMMNGIEGTHYKKLSDGSIDTSSGDFSKKRQNDYVGGWNQIFLKKDPDQVAESFELAGARKSSDASIARAKELKTFITSDLEKTKMQNATQNLQSDTYNKQWSVLTDNVDTMCTQYVMGQIGEKDWKSFVKGLIDSDDYKAIVKEFKKSAAALEK